jgi:hypothetical protein
MDDQVISKRENKKIKIINHHPNDRVLETLYQERWERETKYKLARFYIKDKVVQEKPPAKKSCIPL